MRYIFLVLFFPFLGLAAKKIKPPVPSNAVASFSKIRPLLYQVRTASDQNAAKSSYGTGFVIHKDGWLMTNFHVVADSVWSTKTEKVFVRDGDQLLPAEVIAVDIVHDLAIVQISKVFPRIMPFAKEEPKHGETLFSLGLPKDLDWTVITGTYNGQLTQGPYSLMHLTTPLNKGMSGGPTVNEKSELVGINVSGLPMAQNISFAEPLKYVYQLIELAKTSPAKTEQDLMDQMHTQLVKVQKSLTTDILNSMDHLKKLQGWKIPTLYPLIKCWGESIHGAKDKYEETSENCEMENSAYMDDDFDTGSIRWDFRFFRNRSLSSRQYRRLLNDYWKKPRRTRDQLYDRTAILNYGPFRCSRHLILVEKRNVQIEICSRAMTPFSDLFESHIKLSRTDLNQKSFFSYLILDGFKEKNILEIAEKMVGTLGVETDAQN